MNFANPAQFYWLILVVLVGALEWRAWSGKKRFIEALFDLNVLSKIFSYDDWRRQTLRGCWLEFAGVLTMTIALCGPQMGQVLRAVKSRGINLFVLVDCSDSMLAEDFKPTRMEKSKRLLSALLEKLAANRVGVIAFAGEPFVFCPLTVDVSTVKQFLKMVEPGMIPQPGTRIGAAVRLALEKLPEGARNNAIVLLTDGEDHRSDPLSAADQAKKAGTRIFAIGIGSPDGEPIPVKDASGNVTGFRKDKKGEVVLSRLGESDLAQMALATGGSYFRASESEQELDLLAEKLSEVEKDLTTRKSVDYEDRYQWFLAAALIFLLASGLRKPARNAISSGAEPRAKSARKMVHALFPGVVAAVLVCSNAAADTFSGLMKQGEKYYSQKKYEEAAHSFEKAQEKNRADSRASYNRGSALYRAQEWDAASEEFKKSASGREWNVASNSYYNLGNAQVQKGSYSDAVRSYQQSLRLNPSDSDARANLQLALQMMKMSPPQKQKSQGNEQKKSGQKQGKGGESQERKQEKQEDAKRTLKSAADSQNDKPVFKPKEKEKKNQDDEDW